MRKLPLPGLMGLLFLLCVLLAAADNAFLQYRFAGYDLSPLIDAGWRVFSGQVPNRDFICTFPPILYLAVGLAFHVLGVRWFAVTCAGGLFSLLLTVAGLRVLYQLRRELDDGGLRWLALVYSGLQMMLLLAVGFPWHSTWTQSIAIYTLLGTFGFVRSGGSESSAAGRPHTPELIGHLALGQALLLLAKPNVALPVLLFCNLALLLARRVRVCLLAASGGAVLASVLLATVHTSVWTTFALYRQLTSRFRPGGYLRGIFYDRDLAAGVQHWIVYALLLPVVAWALLIVVRPKKSTPLALRVLVVGALLATWIGMGTNVEFRLVDAPCLLLGAAMLAVCVSSWHSSFGRASTGGAVYALLAVALFYGFSRARMQEAGVWAEAETCGTEAAVQDKFFGAFTSCRNLLSVLDETDAALRSVRPASVFFGPRMEFLYAREQLASPRGLPLWWHPGSSYPLRLVPQIVEAFDQDKPAMLVFLHDDRSYMPPRLLEHMDRDYRLLPHPPSPRFEDLEDDPTAHIDVYLRR